MLCHSARIVYYQDFVCFVAYHIVTGRRLKRSQETDEKFEIKQKVPARGCSLTTTGGGPGLRR